MKGKNSRISADKQKKRIGKSKHFCLPASDTISEWFSEDHMDRLKRIYGPDSNYDKYSVYEVYKKSKGAL